MVKLNKIYTRTGDDGSTGLVGGGRVSKASARVGCYGTVDEANAAIGLAIVEAGRAVATGCVERAIARELRVIQNDLFDLGADLATPGEEENALRIVAGQVDRLEGLIDRFNEPLEALTSFVLPGGTPLAAALHLARTIVRRGEREVVAMGDDTSHGEINPEAVRYLNRLSDLLFVLGRVANGGRDVMWVPGASR